MFEVLSRIGPKHSLAADVAGPTDHLLTARQMIENLGKMAISAAIDRQVQAGLLGDRPAEGFWSRVCGELVRIEIAIGTDQN